MNLEPREYRRCIFAAVKMEFSLGIVFLLESDVAAIFRNIFFMFRSLFFSLVSSF